MSQPTNEEPRDFREYLREHLPQEWLDVDDAIESYSAATVMIVLSLLLRLAQDTRATLFSDQFFHSHVQFLSYPERSWTPFRRGYGAAQFKLRQYR